MNSSDLDNMLTSEILPSDIKIGLTRSPVFWGRISLFNFAFGYIIEYFFGRLFALHHNLLYCDFRRKNFKEGGGGISNMI